MTSLALFLGLSMPFGAHAQALTALSLERTLLPSNILTTRTQTAIPVTTQVAISAGALEMREQLNYNAALNTLTSTLFVVPATSPNPTNLNELPYVSFIGSTSMAIDNIYITSTPYNSVEFIGKITQSTNGPYGNYLGASGTFSLGFTSDKPPSITNVIETFGGAVAIYSASSKGSFTISRPAVNTGNSSLSININGLTSTNPVFTTAVNQIMLDASGSTPANSKFEWSLVSGSAVISFPDGKPSVANVQLASGKITYVIKLTVTDAKGSSSVALVTINLV